MQDSANDLSKTSGQPSPLLAHQLRVSGGSEMGSFLANCLGIQTWTVLGNLNEYECWQSYYVMAAAGFGAQTFYWFRALQAVAAAIAHDARHEVFALHATSNDEATRERGQWKRGRRRKRSTGTASGSATAATFSLTVETVAEVRPAEPCYNADIASPDTETCVAIPHKTRGSKQRLPNSQAAERRASFDAPR